ncbi:non-ribosomal peptide synthetase-like protein [Dothistroma septosporum NZE10]|uniref:Non-ribosomal peptide synthetase-like protein n=1 Tax=Dothistroma septosporum (strain NZE10 / CBS 128990) TaxID=675120 RepID=N1PJJ8_DOTSN|nr:non-ribosomal peptide synthetase-like protein [Dothistroma septosporum NZE10]
MAAPLSISNGTPTKLPGPQLLHELVPREAQDGAVAIEHTDQDGRTSRLEYDAFHRQTDSLARRITSRIQRSATHSKRLIIPILIPQSPELYISQLAILKAGGAFCPIVLDVPEERLRFILADVDATVLLTTSKFRRQLPDLKEVQVIAVDDDSDDAGVVTGVCLPAVSPHDPAYIMYTSGSTGQPKGVVLQHSAVTQALLAHDLHIPKFSRFLQFASPTFDVSVFEIFFPWFRGQTLVSCDRRRLLNDLPLAINELRVDACELTPSVASSLLRGRASVPALKVLLTIGEMLKPSVVEEFGGGEDAPAVLHGMYGPTEATIHCTLQTNFPRDMSCNAIGVPLDTVSTFIIKITEAAATETPDIEILPIGEEGELAVGGYQIADGYLNRDEQTRSVFVSHSEYGVLYRTGDRAKMLPDGSLECLGRISSGQVKLRGQRIELGEIEHAASRTPGCRDVVAEVLFGSLVVFCVRKNEAVDKSAVLETCRKWLPAFMVPGDVVMLESLPYLASGKCDRNALRIQYEEYQASQKSDEPTSNTTTNAVMDVLDKTLQSTVSPGSNLAALGLDSLSSIRVVAELRKAGFKQLDAGVVLSASTPANLAVILEREQHSQTHDIQLEAESSYREGLNKALLGVVPAKLIGSIETCFPCTPVQTAMLAETEKDSQAYCNWVELRVRDQDDLAAVENAYSRLAKMHPLLRSGFVAVTGLPYSYATIVWKEVLPDQVQQTKKFKYEIRLESRHDLQRASRVQMIRKGSCIHILLQMHHALFDQWAIDILKADLADLLSGSSPRHSESFKRVSDYYISNAEQAHSSSAMDFWQAHLRDVIPTGIPLMRGQDVSSDLQRTDWRALSCQAPLVKRKAREFGCSSPAIFQSALAIILGSYVGFSDITFGSVFSGRTIPVQGVDGIFGPCLATLPFRVDFSTARTCRDLLGAVTGLNRAMQEHILTPPTAIRKAAGMAPGVLLFDTLFVWQETAFAVDQDCRIELVDSQDRLEFNLVLEFEPSSTVIKARATYQRKLLSADQAGVLLQQIDAICKIMLDNPDYPTEGLLDRLQPELQSISNSKPTAYAPSVELTKIISSMVTDDPQATAILFANSLNAKVPEFSSVTYAELDSRANRIAHRLVSAGLKPGGIVCICMEKCIDLYITMLASFKAGAGYLPLVPETPTARIQSILSQAEISLFVCDEDTIGTFEPLTNSPILTSNSMDLANSSDKELGIKQSGSRIAYLVFTSGSTGEPKGVAITMDNLKGNLAVLAELYGPERQDRLLQSCSQAFDVSVFEIFFAFYTGMCLCSATKDVMYRDFEHSIRSFHATHLSLTPTVAALVNPKNVPGVHFLITAGEGITEKVHRLWAGNGLHQGYGPSETTNICSVKMNLSQDDVLGNIGPPFKNTSAFVLAPGGDFRILPIGAYGEFAFGGEQVFRGYVGRDDLNATKIIDHSTYGRVYRSGDMGRILPDGSLLIAGRLDDQIKIRGNRIELGELNSIVSDHPGVHDCTTIVLGEQSNDQTLATFWVPIASKAQSKTSLAVVSTASGLVEQIFHRLEDSVPTYMVPSFLVPLNRLPMTTQGKLDKRLLRSAFDSMQHDARDAYSRSHENTTGDGPESPVERSIADTLAEMLHITPANISRHSSFFALGLNSLNAIQLGRILEKALETPVSITTILRHSTVARLARALSQLEDDSQDSTLNVRDVLKGDFIEVIRTNFAGRGLAIDAILPCTPLQQAMLSASATQETVAYCNTTKLNISGDLYKLQDCWYEMMRRHAILRTSFTETPLADHPYAQVIVRDPPLPWYNTRAANQMTGRSNGHVNGHEGHAKHANGYSMRRSTVPAVTPQSPIRFDQDGSDVYLQMHHAIYDGISVSNLFAEIRSLHGGECLPPSVSFEPFLREVLAQNGPGAIDFWSSRMHDFCPHPLPTRSGAGQHEEVFERAIPMNPIDMAAFNERHSCTGLIVFQAALVKTLACLQNVTDLCFGNVVSGRSVPVRDIDRLVAPCFNTIPLRTKLDTIRTNLDLIHDLQRNNMETLKFQLTAPRHIQPLSMNPAEHLFDSVLLLQPPQSDADLWAVEENEMDMGIPLVFEVTPRTSDFDLTVHYLPERVPDTLVPAIADAFVASLMSCLRYPSSPVKHFLDFKSSRIADKLIPQIPSAFSKEGQEAAEESTEWDSNTSTVRDIFAKLAKIDQYRIGKQTSLYQIGLDSLNAVQVASMLRAQGFKVDAADVMQYQSPSALASFFQSRQNESAQGPQKTVDLVAFDRAHRAQIVQNLNLDESMLEAVRPCTATQNGMLAQYMQSQGSYYFNHSTYVVPSEYSFDDIKTAWSAVKCKHQVLRMGFCQLEDATQPFAMLIYQSGTFLNLPFTPSNDMKHDELEQLASEEVFKALHLPAWRLSLTSSQHGRRMCLSLHHALYDANSLRVLFGDFAKALRSHDLGIVVDIDSELSTQLEGARQQKPEHEKFWKTALQPAQLAKFPSLATTMIKDAHVSSAQMWSRLDLVHLENFCKVEGVTVQALGQAVWAILLAAYLGEPAVTFGTVFSGFASHASQPVAFPTISTVPVFCDTGKASSSMIRDMVSYNASAQRHRFAPLADIQRYAGSAGQALFDTIFIYQKSAAADDNHFDWQSVSDSLSIDYAASMEMEAQSAGKPSLRLTYDTKYIPDDHGLLILEQYDMILAEIVDKKCGSRRKNNRLLSYSAPKEDTLPSPVTLLHEFLEVTAQRYPQKPALEFIYSLEDGQEGRKRWNYQEVDQRANQVAHLIQKHGVQPGSVIAVCMSKCPEASFAFAGILKAGCSFLAMDPELPIARRTFIVEDSRSKLLFVDNGRHDAGMARVVQNIELTEHVLQKLPSHKVEMPPVDPSATSYCLYTSGTTGTPKGCELTHENAVQAMLAFQRLFAGHWTESSRWLQFASYWFDVSILEQFWSWSVAITVVGAPRDLVLEDIAGFIREAHITHIDLTPSLARLVMPEEVPSLWNNVFITGGEALKQEIIDRWGPYKTICNGYGPTEATIGVTMNRFIGDDAKPSNIGPCFDNVGAYVLIPGTDEIVMRGAVGELCMSGKLVGKGYLNRPDLTTKAFPYLKRHGERVYRTGDLVRLLADGTVSFIGRADTQAKLRGQRLEIDEIDVVIKACSGQVHDVASLVVKADGNREMLISFPVDADARSRDLHLVNSARSIELVQIADQACRDHLPGYMVPTHVIPLSRLPLTVNNKVDTKRLVALFCSLTTQDLQQLKGDESNSRALRPAEQKVAKVLGRLLSVSTSEMTPSSNIFSLGLSSVSAINFATQLKRAGFGSANVAKIMKHPNIDRLAKAVSSEEAENQEDRNSVRQAQLTVTAFAQRHRGLSAQALGVRASEIEALAPCTPLQEGLLIESLKTVDRPYFNHFWYDVTSLDGERLAVAVQKLIFSIPVLRTAFVRTDEGFAQVALRERKNLLETLTIAHDDIEALLSKQRRRWAAEADEDVARPLEFLIVRSPQRAWMAVHAHHATYDGISWDLTIRRLTELYTTRDTIEGGANFFHVLPYGPLCHRRDAGAFWRNRLWNVPFIPLKSSEQDSKESLFVQAQVSNTQALEQLRRDLGVSHQALLQAAFAVAVHQFSPQTQTYGVVLSGRSIAHDDAGSVIGPMFNTLPYTLNFQASHTWTQYLQRCQQTNAETLPFQHTPLREIRKACGREPWDPMFDVLFVFQRPEADDNSPDAILEPIDTFIPAEYPLAVEVELNPSGEITITVAAQHQYAEKADLQQLVDIFQKALDAISHSTDQKISASFTVVENETPPPERRHSERDLAQLDGVQDYEWTDDANMLRESIAQVAGCNSDDVTEHVAIFTLGLDSIDVVKLASRLKRSGLSIPVSKILQAQTIPRILDSVQDNGRDAMQPSPASRLSFLEANLRGLSHGWSSDFGASVERTLPAAPGQEALIADMVKSDFNDYYNFDILRLHDDVNLERLKSAWQTVVDASPILRTSFVEIADPDIDVVFAQVVHKPIPISFGQISTSSLKDLSASIEELREDVRTSYTSSPPTRLTIATVGGDQYLILALAHAQYDGHSLTLLHQDVTKAYHGSFQPRPLYDETIESALSATNDNALDFWRNTLTGAKVTRFGNAEDDANAATHYRERTSSTPGSAARAVCKRLGVSLQALVQTTWSLLLAHYTQDFEVLYGLVLGCRDSEEAQEVLFPTMNTVPIRATLYGTGVDMLRSVQATINDVRQYQKTPLRAIQAACSKVVNISTSSSSGLFDTLFIYQHQEQRQAEQDITLYESVDGSSSIEYPVAVEAEIVHEDIMIRASCKDQALDQRATESLLKKFDHVLGFLISSTERSIMDFQPGRVSICGLPSFPMREEILSRQTTQVAQDDRRDDEEEDSPQLASIRAAMAQVAKVSEIDVTSRSTIESLGIDSISAIKVAALLRKQSVKLSVSDMLKAQTPLRMAQSIRNAASSQPIDGTASKDVISGVLRDISQEQVARFAGVASGNIETVMPATAGEVYMLSMWHKTGGELFCPTFSYRLEGHSSAEVVKRAWQKVVHRNSILRTIFVLVPGNKDVLQVVLREAPSSFSVGSGEPELQAQPFVGLRAEISPGTTVLRLKIHHALYDAVSLPLLMQDLQTALNGNASPMPEIGFSDFVAESLTAETKRKRQEFWTQYLSDVAALRLHTPRSEGSRKVQIFQPAVLNSCNEMRQNAKSAQVTVQALLFAIYAKVYASHVANSTSSADVVFGVYLANRSQLPELDRLPAPTLNLVPLAVRAPQKKDIFSMAKGIDDDLRNIGASGNATASLEEIRHWTGVTVDSFVNFLHLPDAGDEELDKAKSDSTIIQLDDEWSSEVSRIVEPRSPSGCLPETLRDFVVSDAYQHSVDVEISMKKDQLGIGLFCLEDMFNMNESQAVIEDIKKELHGLG